MATARVHIVDDDDAVRDSLRALLESYDMSVSDFSSAQDYIDQADHKEKACLLLDVHMQDMDGIDLLKYLRASHIATPTIVITGRTDRLIKEAARAAGALAVLDKPVQESELMVLIRNALSLD